MLTPRLEVTKDITGYFFKSKWMTLYNLKNPSPLLYFTLFMYYFNKNVKNCSSALSLFLSLSTHTHFTIWRIIVLLRPVPVKKACKSLIIIDCTHIEIFQGSFTFCKSPPLEWQPDYIYNSFEFSTYLFKGTI